MRIAMLGAVVLSLFAGTAFASGGETATVPSGAMTCANSSSADATLFADKTGTDTTDGICTPCGQGWYCVSAYYLQFLYENASCTRGTKIYCSKGCVTAPCGSPDYCRP